MFNFIPYFHDSISSLFEKRNMVTFNILKRSQISEDNGCHSVYQRVTYKRGIILSSRKEQIILMMVSHKFIPCFLNVFIHFSNWKGTYCAPSMLTSSFNENIIIYRLRNNIAIMIRMCLNIRSVIICAICIWSQY